MRLLPDDQELGWTPYAWLIYLAFFVGFPAIKVHGSTTGEWIATLAGLAVFLVLYFRSFWVSGNDILILSAAMTILGVIYYPFNYGAGSFFIYAAANAGWAGTTRKSVLALAAIEFVVITQVVVAGIPMWHAIWPLIFVGIIGGTTLHQCQVRQANARLRLAQDEIEHLAKAAERERIARDLHDLLGHTLSLIILKSELATKLAERDVERARNEIRDVERISRDALAQVRAAVRGYRSGGLAAEVESARHTLEAAGVRLEADVAPLALTHAQEAVLALAIREGVTNIVRHARASVCRVTLGRTDGACVLTIADDGRGGHAELGSGLSGMRERIESAGGTFTHDGSRGTTLTMTMPVAQTLLSVRGERSA